VHDDPRGKIAHYSPRPEPLNRMETKTEDTVRRVSPVRTFAARDLSALSERAATAKRLRANLNVHASPAANVQRLFISTEPGTYIRPHRHAELHKWEFFLVVRGRLDLLVFGNTGDLQQRIVLSPETTPATEIAPGTFHSYVCMRPGSVALEVKEGAYIPTTEQDFAPWAPAEQSADVAAYLAWMQTAEPPARSPTHNVG
jgi:cupin fold WbuC family metalloprotein